MPDRRKPMARRVPISTVRSTTAVFMVLLTVKRTMAPISEKISQKWCQTAEPSAHKNGFRVRKSSTTSGWTGENLASMGVRRVMAARSGQSGATEAMMDVALGGNPCRK
jgi:hypothetical protein